jgi:hypothetical protein
MQALMENSMGWVITLFRIGRVTCRYASAFDGLIRIMHFDISSYQMRGGNREPRLNLQGKKLTRSYRSDLDLDIKMNTSCALNRGYTPETRVIAAYQIATPIPLLRESEGPRGFQVDRSMRS